MFSEITIITCADFDVKKNMANTGTKMTHYSEAKEHIASFAAECMKSY